MLNQSALRVRVFGSVPSPLAIENKIYLSGAWREVYRSGFSRPTRRRVNLTINTSVRWP